MNLIHDCYESLFIHAHRRSYRHSSSPTITSKREESGLLAEEEERKGEMRVETMVMIVGMGETMRGGDVVCVGESCPLTAHPFLR